MKIKINKYSQEFFRHIGKILTTVEVSRKQNNLNIHSVWVNLIAFFILWVYWISRLSCCSFYFPIALKIFCRLSKLLYFVVNLDCPDLWEQEKKFWWYIKLDCEIVCVLIWLFCVCCTSCSLLTLILKWG